MIPQAYIQAWRANAPWPNLAQVEQDLIISTFIARLRGDSWRVTADAVVQLRTRHPGLLP